MSILQLTSPCFSLKRKVKFPFEELAFKEISDAITVSRCIVQDKVHNQMLFRRQKYATQNKDRNIQELEIDIASLYTKIDSYTVISSKEKKSA